MFTHSHDESPSVSWLQAVVWEAFCAVPSLSPLYLHSSRQCQVWQIPFSTLRPLPYNACSPQCSSPPTFFTYFSTQLWNLHAGNNRHTSVLGSQRGVSFWGLPSIQPSWMCVLNTCQMKKIQVNMRCARKDGKFYLVRLLHTVIIFV
jgi:hypothetical protein